MIKAIIFDLGGVVLDMKPLLNKFVTIFQPKEKDKFWNELNIEAIPLCKGEMNELQYWKDIAKRFDRKIPDDVLKTLWTKDYEKLTKVDREVMSIIRSLKKNYKLALISNIIEPCAIIHRKQGIFDVFDVVILSCEVKMAKESKEMYMLAVKQLNVKPEECIFIDDIDKFTEIARSIGMKTILFKSAEQLKKELVSFSVNIN